VLTRLVLSSKDVNKITDEEEDEEDDVDDEFSESRLDLDVTLGAVFRQSRSPQRYSHQTLTSSKHFHVV